MAAAPANQANIRFWAAARIGRLPGALALLLATSGCIEDAAQPRQEVERVDGAATPDVGPDVSGRSPEDGGGPDPRMADGGQGDRGAVDQGPELLSDCREAASELVLCAASQLNCPALGDGGELQASARDGLLADCRAGRGIASVLPLDELGCVEQLERAASVGVAFGDLCSQCPVPAVAEEEIAVAPLNIVRLDGSPSVVPLGASEATRYDWMLVTAPPTSSQAVAFERFTNVNRPQDGGQPDDPATPAAVFFADVPGAYVFELRVTGANGLVAPSEACQSAEARVRIDASVEGDFYVQVTWDTAGDLDLSDGEGTDVDLHLLHPMGRNWDQAPLDCYYANKTPDWGQAGPAGNPTLDIDDTNGNGPEVIHVEAPEDTAILGAPYQVGVHYYRAESFMGGSYGPSIARLQIYIGRVLAFDEQKMMRHSDHFWAPANLGWVGGEGEVMPVGRYFYSMP